MRSRCVAVADKAADEAAWLETRRSLVTASDTPALMGVGYKTSSQLFYEKLNGSQPVDNEWMRRGREAEPAIVERAARGRPYRRFSALLRSCEHPWLGASPDAVVRAQDGSYALIEAKWTRDMRNLTPKRMAAYGWQLRHQLVVCGYYRGIIAVLDSYGRFDVVSLNITPLERARLLAVTHTFKKCLDERQLPLQYGVKIPYDRNIGGDADVRHQHEGNVPTSESGPEAVPRDDGS